MKNAIAMLVCFAAVTLHSIGADYYERESLGTKQPGDVVSATVNPPGTVTEGHVTNAGGWPWSGSLATFTATVPQNAAGSHMSRFDGKYVVGGGAGTGTGSSRELTWQMDVDADAAFGITVSPNPVCVCPGGTTVTITANLACTYDIVRLEDNQSVASGSIAAGGSSEWAVPETIEHGKYKIEAATGAVGPFLTDTEIADVRNDQSSGTVSSIPGSYKCKRNENKDCWEKVDECGRKLELRCEGAFVMRDDGVEVARCIWANGQNESAYVMTKDDCRHFGGLWFNRDPEGKGEPGVAGDEGVKGTAASPKYDFWFYAWNSVTGGRTKKHYVAGHYPAVPGQPGVVEVP